MIKRKIASFKEAVRKIFPNKEALFCSLLCVLFTTWNVQHKRWSQIWRNWIRNYLLRVLLNTFFIRCCFIPFLLFFYLQTFLSIYSILFLLPLWLHFPGSLRHSQMWPHEWRNSPSLCQWPGITLNLLFVSIKLSHYQNVKKWRIRHETMVSRASCFIFMVYFSICFYLRCAANGFVDMRIYEADREKRGSESYCPD